MKFKTLSVHLVLCIAGLTASCRQGELKPKTNQATVYRLSSIASTTGDSVSFHYTDTLVTTVKINQTLRNYAYIPVEKINRIKTISEGGKVLKTFEYSKVNNQTIGVSVSMDSDSYFVAYDTVNEIVTIMRSNKRNYNLGLTEQTLDYFSSANPVDGSGYKLVSKGTDTTGQNLYDYAPVLELERMVMSNDRLLDFLPISFHNKGNPLGYSIYSLTNNQQGTKIAEYSYNYAYLASDGRVENIYVIYHDLKDSTKDKAYRLRFYYQEVQ